MNSSELRKKISDYIDESISLLELEEWFVPRLREFIADPNAQDAELIAALELALTEYSEGMHDEEMMRRLVAGILRDEKIKAQPLYRNIELNTSASPTKLTKLTGSPRLSTYILPVDS